MTKTSASQKIIVASDGSRTARNAVDVAVQIARAESLLVEGFYVVDEPLIMEPYTAYTKELGSDHGVASRANLIEWFEKRGTAVLDQLQEQCASKEVPVITEVLLGGIPELILDKAKQITFLALGRRGHTHADETNYLGKNFRHIAHHAQIPLIVGGDTARPLQRIFLVYDGSKQVDAALRLALQLNQALSATLAVGVTEHSYLEDDFDALVSRFSEGGIVKENIIDLRSKPAEKIVEAIHEHQSNLIVMGSYRHPEIMEWLVGGPNDQILRQSPLPAVIA
jgi:nucleotide-binding universal stress UspA family protein